MRGVEQASGLGRRVPISKYLYMQISYDSTYDHTRLKYLLFGTPPPIILQSTMKSGLELMDSLALIENHRVTEYKMNKLRSHYKN